jgi:6-pyruvoyltetrahydropterin/6-carboxytetrahydropterin synthase
MEIFKVFRIDAAHYLPNVPEGHKCGQMHGHSFRVEIYVRGPIDPKLGWVIDFNDIAKAFSPLYDQLDHRCLNHIEGLENPTSENMAKWIWKRLRPMLPILSKIVVQESPDSGCLYEGEEE